MSDARLLYEQGRRAEQQGRFTEALRFYRACIKQDPSFREAFNNLGALYARAKRPDLSIGFFRRALELGEDETVCFNLGSELFRLERFDQSEYYLVRSLHYNRRLVRAHVLLAYLYRKQKRLDRAAIYFANAVKLEPGNRPAALGYALLLSDDRKFAEALQAVRAYLAVSAGDEMFRKLEAGLLLQAQDYKQSTQAYTELARTATGFKSFTDHLAAVRQESEGEFKEIFAGIDDKIRRRADRLRERLRKRKEWLANRSGGPPVEEPAQLQSDLKDMVDLSFLHLFNGDTEKAMAFLFQARKMKRDSEGN